MGVRMAGFQGQRVQVKAGCAWRRTTARRLEVSAPGHNTRPWLPLLRNLQQPALLVIIAAAHTPWCSICLAPRLPPEAMPPRYCPAGRVTLLPSRRRGAVIPSCKASQRLFQLLQVSLQDSASLQTLEVRSTAAPQWPPRVPAASITQ